MRAEVRPVWRMVTPSGRWVAAGNAITCSMIEPRASGIGLAGEGLERHRSARASARTAQAHAYSLWNALLDQDISQIVRQMLEDSPKGELLRDTQPVFTVISSQGGKMAEVVGLQNRPTASPERRE